MTREQAVKVAGLLGPARAAVKAMEDALRAHVEAFGEVPLPDGKVYGPDDGRGYDLPHAGALPGDGGRVRNRSLVPSSPDKVAKQMTARNEGAIYDAIDEAHEFARALKRQRKTPLSALCPRRAWLQRNVG